MVKAFSGNGGVMLRLGEDERSLDDGLSVKGEAFRGPAGVKAACGDGSGNVGLHLAGMGADVAIAGLADSGMSLVSLLDHGAQQAGELGKLAEENCLAKVDVAEQAVDRVGQAAIGSLGKRALGHGRKMLGGGQGQVFLALEVVKETALGEAGGFADVFDASS